MQNLTQKNSKILTKNAKFDAKNAKFDKKIWYCNSWA